MDEKIKIDLQLFLNMATLIKRWDELSQQEFVYLQAVVMPQIEDKIDRIYNSLNYKNYVRATTKEEKMKWLAEYLKRYEQD